MIHYRFYTKNSASHYIYIDMTVDNPGTQLHLQLPAWRPGRYELGNFAKNVKRVDAFNENGEPLAFSKQGKDLWVVEAGGCASVKVTYSYYSAELNAGSCYSDAGQMYVNPVHCCMYVPDRMHEAHSITLDIPGTYNVVTSMKHDGNHLFAQDFHELADSPFIASDRIQTHSYEAGGRKFYLHFNGECSPDVARIISDFTSFTNCQLHFWGDMPVEEYHFIFQVLPNKFYHGVEHLRSTVVALGPGYAINTGAVYEDLLGVSSHELFHVWNVKTIRPAEMMPYDYTKENFARTGYVYEGFTTYYGDKLLLTSGVFSIDQYFGTLCERLQKHFHNYGRFNLGVAQSSWDTWLDGYVPGAPYRKTSIYDEGCLIAFILDVRIMQQTEHAKSLRDVCRLLYERFGKTGKGYTEQDVLALVNEVSGQDYTEFFSQHVNAPSDFSALLEECFSYLGINFIQEPSAYLSERDFGFKTVEGPFSRIALVAPYSPAWKAGLFQGDEIIAVNGRAARGNTFGEWLAHFSGSGRVELTVISNDALNTVTLSKDDKGRTWFATPVLKLHASAGGNFEAWKMC